MNMDMNIFQLSLTDDGDIGSLSPIGFDDTDTGAAEITPPERFLLVRYGDNDYTKGETPGKFSFAETDADEIIKEFAARGKDVVIDYEHQTLNGGEAPASGWIRKIEKTDSGLEAEVEWTKRAADRLKNREYRYQSPVLHFRAGRPFRLHSVALTNHPALHGYPALVADDNKNPNQQEEEMNEHLKALATMSGVTVVALADGKEDEKATAKAIEARISELLAIKPAEFLKLHDCKDLDAVTLKIQGMVPAAEKASLEAKLAEIEAEKAVTKAFADCKLVEAQRAWALGYAKKDLVAFTDYVKAAPVVSPGPAAGVPSGEPAKEDGKLALTDEAKTIYQKIGLSDDQIKNITEVK